MAASKILTEAAAQASPQAFEPNSPSFFKEDISITHICFSLTFTFQKDNTDPVLQKLNTVIGFYGFLLLPYQPITVVFMNKANRSKDKFRTLVISGLMLVSLLMMGLLSHQIFMAVSSQKQLVEGVLRDYSALAADEFTRRSKTIMYGYMPMLRYLSRLEEDAPLPRSDLFNGFEQPRNLAQGLFRFSFQDQAIETSGLSPPSLVLQRLLTAAKMPSQGTSKNPLIRSFNTKYDEEHYNFVYTEVASNLKNRTILGVWINNEAALTC